MPRKRGEREPTRKWKMIRELRETIREEPRTIGDILKITDKWPYSKTFPTLKEEPPRTTINNWLAEPLEALGLIYYNPKDRRWYPSESKLPEPGTPAWNLAVKHTQVLLHGSERQGGPADWQMGFLISHLILHWEDSDVKELLAHLRTGYRHSAYQKLLDYKEAWQKKNKLWQDLFGGLNSPKAIVFRVKGVGPPWMNEELKSKLEKADENEDNLFRQVAGELALIFEQVKKGPRPLHGFCSACPHVR